MKIYNGAMLHGLTSVPAGLSPHCPAALLLLFSGWAGTFAGGARGDQALLGHVALLTFVAVFGQVSPDPLRLGRGGVWLLAALAVSLVASLALSPVARAGRLGLILLPAFLLVPSAVARCWSTAAARRQGLRSLSLVVAGVALWSLFSWWRFETPGASLPLGHHNLLAAWLLALLPLAALPWLDGGAGRWISGLAMVAGVAALLATRSLGAALAVTVVALGFAIGRRGRFVILAIGGLLLVSQGPRLRQISMGADFSVAARWSYLEAGWSGLWERPVFGWGPGAASWTISEHLRPIPGLHPPDQVVADLHCLPLQVAYELGWSGLLLCGALVLMFLRHRHRQPVDPALQRHALLGLAAAGVMSSTGLPLAVTALPLAVAFGVGAVFAAESESRPPRRRLEAILVAVAMAVFVGPLDLAHLAYDRAVDGEGRDEQLHHLRRAVKLDPALPLYRARLAWLQGKRSLGDGEAARQARTAALDARGIAPLWLAAGILGQETGQPWRREVLQRACRLSPLGALAPFRLTLEDSLPAQQVAWASRALLAEPLLLAAVDWQGEQSMVSFAIDALRRLDGVDADWRASLAELYPTRREAGATQSMVLEMDGDDSPVSLYAFRRRAWPVYVAQVAVFADQVAEIDLVAASRLRTTSPKVFQSSACGVGGP